MFCYNASSGNVRRDLASSANAVLLVGLDQISFDRKSHGSLPVLNFASQTTQCNQWCRRR